jgi:peptidoglycan/LPS O-acetylase OafA/YrhL
MLLVLACAGAAGMLAASQFMTIFELTDAGGEGLNEISASDQHGYAIFVLAAFALLMLVVLLAARGQGLAQVAAVAVAVCGIVALLIFLIGDLPDVNKVGTLDDARESFIDAKAQPKAGFWFELVGSLVLTACGAGLATIRPGELSGPRGRPASTSADGSRSAEQRAYSEQR